MTEAPRPFRTSGPPNLHVRVPLWMLTAIRSRAEQDGVGVATTVRRLLEAAFAAETADGPGATDA